MVFKLKALDQMTNNCGIAGNGMCPGRFLARDAIISTCALLVERYDIEIITESLDMDPWRFGLSVGRPRSPIAARIRRRR